MKKTEDLTPEEKKAYWAAKSRAFYATAAGKRYQEKVRAKLFNPDWRCIPKRTWTAKDDYDITARIETDRQLAKRLCVSIPAVRQRRIRVNRLPHTAKMYHEIAFQRYTRIDDIKILKVQNGC